MSKKTKRFENIKKAKTLSEIVKKLKNNNKKTRIFEVFDSVRRKECEILEMNKEEFLEMIFETIQLKNRYKGMFMWVQNGWANTRRSEEKWACGSRIFVFDGHVYKYELDYSISCKHYYLHINCCTKDGGGDVRAWKKLIKEIDPDFYKKKFG